MSSPFTDVHVSPHSEPGSLVVEWAVLQPFVHGDFYVYRSDDGVRNWQLLNTQPVRGLSYLDSEQPGSVPFSVMHYRVLLEHEGESYDSPVAGVHDRLTKAEYGAAFTIIRRELLRMRAGNGIQVFHFSRLNSGELTEFTDKETGQVTGIPCPDSDENSQGTPFINGYGNPIQTWLEFSQTGPFTQSIDPEIRQAVKNTHSIKARMLAFPRPRYMDLIVQPATNDRFVIGEGVQGFFFKGVCAVAYEVILERINHGDPRHKINVPVLRKESTAHLMP